MTVTQSNRQEIVDWLESFDSYGLMCLDWPSQEGRPRQLKRDNPLVADKATSPACMTHKVSWRGEGEYSPPRMYAEHEACIDPCVEVLLPNDEPSHAELIYSLEYFAWQSKKPS